MKKKSKAVWIRCSEHPAPIGEIVLLFVGGKVRAGMRYFEADGQIGHRAFGSLAEEKLVRGVAHIVADGEFTHWMPLPAPPQPDQTEEKP